MSDPTPVRGRRGRLVHLTLDLRKALCGRKVDGWIVEPNISPTCFTCVDIHHDIETNGN